MKSFELSNSKKLSGHFFIDKSKSTMYNIFIGSDIMEYLGINHKYSMNTIQWGNPWSTIQSLRQSQDDGTNRDNDCVPEEVYA